MSDAGAKQDIVDAYLEVVQKYRRRPTEDELKAAGLKRNKIRWHWGSPAKLEAHVRKHYPEAYADVPLDELTTRKERRAVRRRTKGTNRFFITTAVTGCDAHPGFLKAIESYCNATNAEPLILTAADPASKASPGGYGYIDSALRPYPIVTEDTKLNQNLFLSTIKLSAKQIDPITGLNRVGQREGSFVYASPKQRLKYTPTSNQKLPHALMTTGAVTAPSYQPAEGRGYMSERTAYIAQHDHVMGGIVAELTDAKTFHFRQTQMSADGSFVDLGKRYRPQGSPVRAPLRALVPGDYHVGDTDPAVDRVIRLLCSQLRPEYLLWHDLFNGASVNPHEAHRTITRARQAASGRLSLRDEVEALAEAVKSYKGPWKQVVVRSNHDEFLDRWLESGAYVQDPHNHRYALDLAGMLLDGLNPLEVEIAARAPGAVHKWLKRDEDLILEGVQCGAHGDKGANGARGSLPSMERAYGKSITGHSHVAEILRGAWSVGTSTWLRLPYTQGPSSWTQTMCLLYEGGTRQLVNVIDGSYTSAA